MKRRKLKKGIAVCATNGNQIESDTVLQKHHVDEEEQKEGPLQIKCVIICHGLKPYFITSDLT